MNCTECQEQFVDHQEGLLAEPQRLELQRHLEGCPQCRSDYEAMGTLHQALAAHAQVAAGFSIANRVMNQVRTHQPGFTETSAPHAWGFGKSLFRWAVGGVAAALVVGLVIVLVTSPAAKATAAEIMTRGISAARQLASVHIQFRVRTYPADNFSQIDPKAEFAPVELWKEFGPPQRWRVDKPGRVAVMDGQSTLLYLRPANAAMKIPKPSPSAFDTEWLHQVANIEATLEKELRRAQAQGWKMTVARETDAAGAPKAMVTIETQSGLPEGDYLQNKFFHTADTRRVFRFDDRTGRLESVRIYLRGVPGEPLVMEAESIAYNEPISENVFNLELPSNVAWIDNSKPRTADPKYTGMSAKEAAQAFFEACSRKDWDVMAKFWDLPLDDRIKGFLGGLEIVSLGEPFTSKAGNATFVPYEIRVQGQLRKHNLALKRHRNGAWFVDGGI